MRYIGAAMRIETARVKFGFEWEHLVAPLAGKEPDANQIKEILEAIEKFSLAIREAIERETGAWITEFQTNLSQLDKETKELFENAQNEKKPWNNAQNRASTSNAISTPPPAAPSTPDKPHPQTHPHRSIRPSPSRPVRPLPAASHP